jgi:hypothetical protein
MQTSHAPVTIESHALSTLSYIRASIDSAGSLAVPGSAGWVMGAIGTLAAALTSLPSLNAFWLPLWVVAAVVAFALGGAVMARQASARGATLRSGPFRKFLLCLCPSLLAGAVLTLVLWQADLERLIPGTWMLLYGCAVISASTVTNAQNLRLIATMGSAFIALGLATLWLPTPVHTLALGAGFGALHLLFGILIGRTSGRTSDGE